MSYRLLETGFPSSDGIHNIYAEIYEPTSGEARAIVQLAHGMVDYTGRYAALAEYLAKSGIILAGHHHLGHGKSAKDDTELGFFAKKDGVGYLVRDMHRMNKLLRERYPSLPIILLGHSMGSFITRLYANKYPHTAAAVIIHGTAGPNPILPIGKFIVRVKSLLQGGSHRSKFVKRLAFMGYNSHFDKSEGAHAWLSRDTERVNVRDGDGFTNFTFTLSAYRDLFTMLGRSNSKAWFASYPKDMPTLIVSGDADPVGNYGKGPKYVYKKLLIAGASPITLKLYPEARHELFNETNREQIFADLVEWIGGAIKPRAEAESQ